MRVKVFLLKASCILLSAFLICGQTAPLAFCQQMVAGITTAQPEFMSGLEMAMHYKKEILLNIIAQPKTELIINSPSSVASTDAAPDGTEKKTPQVISIPIVSDSAVISVKDSAAITQNEAAISENKEPTDVIISKPEQALKKETTIISINETHPKFDDPGSFIEEIADPVISKYADMLSVEPSDISNYPLYRFIDKWYGIKYRWGGGNNKGIDCSAFSQKLYSEVFNTEIERTSRQQHRKCERIKDYNDASEGDLIFFRIHRIRITHVGVYLANGYFVHASRSHGVMISSLDSKYWGRRYAGCGKVERPENESESDYTQ